jgi:hypothetical protein
MTKFFVMLSPPDGGTRTVVDLGPFDSNEDATRAAVATPNKGFTVYRKDVQSE